MIKLKECLPIGSVYMLMNGDKAIILHIDDISSTVVYYNYFSQKNERCARSIFDDNLFGVGAWDIEWPKECAYYEGIASVIKAEAYSKILGNRQGFTSNTHCQQMIEL